MTDAFNLGKYEASCAIDTGWGKDVGKTTAMNLVWGMPSEE